MTITLPETFRCLPLGCTLTRTSCGARHEAARAGPRPSAVPRATLVGAKGTCGVCEVGAAHARGERPDVSVASVFARIESKAKTEVGHMPMPAKMHKHNGHERSLKDWQESAENVHGLKLSTIRSRVVGMGMSIGAALAEPMVRKQARSTRGPAMKAPDTPPKRASAIGEVRTVAVGTCEHAALVLTRLGYVVEDAGVVPAGRVLVVREQATTVVA